MTTTMIGGGEADLNVFFYSKYDPHGLGILSRYSIEDVVPVCIDNVNVRNRVLSDQRWNIRRVPCLLKVSSSDQQLIEEPLLSSLLSAGGTEDEDISPGNDEEDVTMGEEEDEEGDVPKSTSTTTTPSISNIIQKMQRERESDDQSMKQQLNQNIS